MLLENIKVRNVVLRNLKEPTEKGDNNRQYASYAFSVSTGKSKQNEIVKNLLVKHQPLSYYRTQN